MAIRNADTAIAKRHVSRPLVPRRQLTRYSSGQQRFSSDRGLIRTWYFGAFRPRDGEDQSNVDVLAQ